MLNESMGELATIGTRDLPSLEVPVMWQQVSVSRVCQLWARLSLPLVAFHEMFPVISSVFPHVNWDFFLPSQNYLATRGLTWKDVLSESLLALQRGVFLLSGKLRFGCLLSLQQT